jgi:hypothetical protein
MTSAPALRWQRPSGAHELPVAAVLPMLRQAVAAAPQRAELRTQLAKSLYHAALIGELLDRFGAAAGEPDAGPELLCYVGRGALAAGDAGLAVDALGSSAEQGFADAFGPFADALHRAGRHDDALRAGLRALEESASDYAALRVVARTLLARGEQQRLWSVCAGLMARGSARGYVPSAMLLAAVTPAQRAEVAGLVDPARWLSSSELGVPSGFNRDLAAELLAHVRAGPLPVTKSTVGTGNRVDQLDIAGGPLTRRLLAMVAAQVDVYCAQRERFASHPLMAQRPHSAVLNSWAVVVRGDGHESWHLHPGGWLSGVYYVAVPSADGTGDERRGAIEFGPHPFAGERTDAAWPRTCVTPHAGMLLLFPSYYGHRTWPTQVDEPRICVAFDVVPAAPPKAE